MDQEVAVEGPLVEAPIFKGQTGRRNPVTNLFRPVTEIAAVVIAIMGIANYHGRSTRQLRLDSAIAFISINRGLRGEGSPKPGKAPPPNWTGRTTASVPSG